MRRSRILSSGCPSWATTVLPDRLAMTNVRMMMSARTYTSSLVPLRRGRRLRQPANVSFHRLAIVRHSNEPFNSWNQGRPPPGGLAGPTLGRRRWRPVRAVAGRGRRPLRTDPASSHQGGIATRPNRRKPCARALDLITLGSGTSWALRHSIRQPVHFPGRRVLLGTGDLCPRRARPARRRRVRRLRPSRHARAAGDLHACR